MRRFPWTSSLSATSSRWTTWKAVVVRVPRLAVATGTARIFLVVLSASPVWSVTLATRMARQLGRGSFRPASLSSRSIFEIFKKPQDVSRRELPTRRSSPPSSAPPKTLLNLEKLVPGFPNVKTEGNFKEAWVVNRLKEQEEAGCLPDPGNSQRDSLEELQHEVDQMDALNRLGGGQGSWDFHLRPTGDWKDGKELHWEFPGAKDGLKTALFQNHGELPDKKCAVPRQRGHLGGRSLAHAENVVRHFADTRPKNPERRRSLRPRHYGMDPRRLQP